MIRLILIFVNALLVTKISNGQSISTNMSAKALGMGNASSSLQDEWSVFNNPGGLGKIKESWTAFAFEASPALPGANRMAAVGLLSTRWGSSAMGIFRFGDNVYSEQLISLCYGNQIGNTSLGAKANYIQYRADAFGTRTAISMDFGGITQITPQITIGAYIINLTQSKLSTSEIERIPTRMVAGIGFHPSEKTTLITELEKDLDFQQPIWRMGMDYKIYKKISFRTGYNLHPSAAFFGIGYQKHLLKIDYAFRYSHFTGFAHQSSVSYLLSKKKR